jgi:hypothetical protein
MCKWISLIVLAPTLIFADGLESFIAQDQKLEFQQLQTQIASATTAPGYTRIKREALRKDALVWPSDASPMDVVIRRTQALAKYLLSRENSPNLLAELKQLRTLKKQNRPDLSEAQQLKLFKQVCAVRRAISFKNPLLDFDDLLFLKHNRQARGDTHMVDQYLGFNQAIGGGVFRLNDVFGAAPVAENILPASALPKGSFISLDLDYDAKSILFAFTQVDYKVPTNSPAWKNQPWTRQQTKRNKHYCWRPESSFHLFRADADGGNLRQLTHGMWNDFDPCFLPNGRIAFISGRSGGTQRCGYRFIPGYTLFSVMGDGSDLVQFSWHDTNEWHPSVNNNGMLVYTRWDYVDRDSDIAHHLWFCYPDGRDPRSMHGNYPDVREMRPWMEMSIRAIPNSGKYIATAASHHGEAYGSLVMIDQSLPDDRAMSQIRRITPHELFPESEKAPGEPHKKGKHEPRNFAFGTPWPLSENFYLCVYDPSPEQRNHGIYLLDSFGNRELLYRDPSIACLDPIPLKPRPRPPILPTQTQQAKADQIKGEAIRPATVAVMNIYESEFPFPPGTKIKELRIVNIFPKSTHAINNPRVAYADQSLARGVLGTVPVEADGSVYFECPPEIGIYFQAIDENGLAVHTMRSDTYLHPGERLSCVGCHEDKRKAPALSAMPMALRRPPSKIKPEPSGSYPLTFPRLVQPVLDAKCVSCHDKNEKAPSLHGDRFVKGSGWSEAMATLAPRAWGKSGGNGALMRLNDRSYSIPGKDGARVSKLWKMLEKGHHGVQLTPEEKRRITLWIDCNSNFYGAYKEMEKQAQGGVVPAKYGFLPEWVN